MAAISQWDKEMGDSGGGTIRNAEVKDWEEALLPVKKEITTLGDIDHVMFYRLQMGNFVYLELKGSE